MAELPMTELLVSTMGIFISWNKQQGHQLEMVHLPAIPRTWPLSLWSYCPIFIIESLVPNLIYVESGGWRTLDTNMIRSEICGAIPLQSQPLHDRKRHVTLPIQCALQKELLGGPALG